MCSCVESTSGRERPDFTFEFYELNSFIADSMPSVTAISTQARARSMASPAASRSSGANSESTQSRADTPPGGLPRDPWQPRCTRASPPCAAIAP